MQAATCQRPRNSKLYSKAQGHNVSVAQLSPNITGAVQGVMKYQINAFKGTPTGNVRDSKRAAEAAYRDMFGTAEPIDGKSAAQREPPLNERFGAAWDYGARQLGLGEHRGALPMAGALGASEVAPVDAAEARLYFSQKGVSGGRLNDATNGIARALSLAADPAMARPYEGAAQGLLDLGGEGVAPEPASNPDRPARPAVLPELLQEARYLGAEADKKSGSKSRQSIASNRR